MDPVTPLCAEYRHGYDRLPINEEGLLLGVLQSWSRMISVSLLMRHEKIA